MNLLNCGVYGLVFILQGFLVCGMNKHVSHFEHLTYDIHDLHSQHERSRRSASLTGQGLPIRLQFMSHGRNFDLRLVRDDSIFHPDAVIENSLGEKVDTDLSYVYHGTLYGKEHSYVHGSILDGIFRGVIYDPGRGKYYVEENTIFFGVTTGYSPISGYKGHSVMYHEDTVKFPKQFSSHDQCGGSDHSIFDRMKKFQESAVDKEPNENILRRKKRAVDDSKTTCLLYIQTDYILWHAFPSRELIISKIADHVKAATDIYKDTVFTTRAGQKIRGINFKVQRLKINDTASQKDLSNPFRSPNIGVEKFLEIVSLANHDDYCLAYVFTNRDFDNGVLGLAWVGSVTGNSGGICEKFKIYSDRSAKSLNTGIITFKNYGSIMPARVSHITFAHELGHNFGSPHDSGIACTPGESTSYSISREGNYIMFARATSGTEANNVKFSPCSIRNISLVLEARKDRCFVSSNQPICGNQIVDEGEECDCGYTDTCAASGDKCCTPADSQDTARRCHLKATSKCSISQGPCCNGETCDVYSSSRRCSNETECQFAQYCNNSADCPIAPIAPNGTKKCLNGTHVCRSGECIGSICLAHPSLEACECKVAPGSTDRSFLCHTCCRLKGKADTCKSTGDPAYAAMFENRTIYLQPGSACDDYNGYCDVFSKCRLVDADGPLSRLKQAIFNPELYSNIRRWIVEYWWAVMMMGLALILLMVGFIKVCSVHTPTSNPSLPKHRHFPGRDTLQRRRRSRQHQPRRSVQDPQYEMARRSR